jgi:hypothetical protein
MLRNNNEDWENRPIKHGLSAAERQRILDLYEERALARKAAEERAFAVNLQLGKLLKGD